MICSIAVSTDKAQVASIVKYSFIPIPESFVLALTSDDQHLFLTSSTISLTLFCLKKTHSLSLLKRDNPKLISLKNKSLI